MYDDNYFIIKMYNIVIAKVKRCRFFWPHRVVEEKARITIITIDTACYARRAHILET